MNLNEYRLEDNQNVYIYISTPGALKGGNQQKYLFLPVATAWPPNGYRVATVLIAFGGKVERAHLAKRSLVKACSRRNP